ncbi:MAG: hypothetical protein HYT34_00865 [Candidatus Ryanbacteria bacterium]|nr:hypothetical protein [Candidatus Ryanbacteria bacterium]
MSEISFSAFSIPWFIVLGALPLSLAIATRGVLKIIFIGILILFSFYPIKYITGSYSDFRYESIKNRIEKSYVCGRIYRKECDLGEIVKEKEIKDYCRGFVDTIRYDNECRKRVENYQKELYKRETPVFMKVIVPIMVPMYILVYSYSPPISPH